MNIQALVKSLCALLLTGSLATPAVGGGPLYLYDPATRTPGAWPAGDTPVFLDLGPLGQLSNAEADAMVTFSIDQWNAVASSTFHGTIAGDFSDLGLPDIDASNLFDLVGVWNGGGIHVVYDADGSIHESLFGQYGSVTILGASLIEWVDEDSPAILEAVILLNGLLVPNGSVADAMAYFAGVSTHELGHTINLDHSQTNGQMFFFTDWGPDGCPPPFYRRPAPDEIETMYPFLESIGEAMSTVDRLDDIATLSDLYPEAGWPTTHGAIEGSILVPDRGPHTEPFTGVNVTARNAADPFGDAISAISGDYTQGRAGPDGSYQLHGLTPDASYYLYIDGLMAGSFETPYPAFFPGPEEYYNGAQESGDGLTDDRCAYTTIDVTSGDAAVADVTFNRVKGAPVMRIIDLPWSNVTDLSGDGRVAVGSWGDGIFRWTPETGAVPIGGTPYSLWPGISEDGETIVGDIIDSTMLGYEVLVAAIWQGGESWAPIGVVPGHLPCGGYLLEAWDVSDTGTVVGRSWDQCEASAYQWTSESGVNELDHWFQVPNWVRYGYAEAVSADGTLVVGGDEDINSLRRGVRWDNGQVSPIELPSPAICASDPDHPDYLRSNVGSARKVTTDGSAIVGDEYPVERVVDLGGGQLLRYCDDGAWLWTPSDGIQWLGEFQYEGYDTFASGVSDDARVIVGSAWTLDPWFGWVSRPLIWTPDTGSIDFQEFLAAQGTWLSGWFIDWIVDVSADGRVVAAKASTPLGVTQSFVVEMPKVVICHRTPASKKKATAKMKTIDITFPDDLGDHLAHGDTIGICGNGM